MSVPPEDILCRFIDPKDWSDDDQRPALSAFKSSRDKHTRTNKLSLWHQDRIVNNGSQIRDLCIDLLAGFGEALITTRDILDSAKDLRSPVFKPQVLWRPDEVVQPWVDWKDAHVNVESEQPSSGFPDDFRLLLAERCYVSRPPDRNEG